ncbi:MAG: BatD family protein [Bacteroidia bacterium]
MKKRLLLISCLVFFSRIVSGQEIQLYSGKPFITLDDQLQLILIVKGDPLSASPVFPEITGFSRVTSKDLSSLVRRYPEEVHYSQYYHPLKTGKFTVPPFAVATSSGTRMTRKLLVEVEKPSVLNKFEDVPVDISIAVVPDKNTCYAGEQITAEVIATIADRDLKFVRFLPVSISDIARQASSVGLLIEGVADPIQATPIVANGFTRLTLARLYIFPAQPGIFTLNDLKVQVERQQVIRNRKNVVVGSQTISGEIPIPPATFEAKAVPPTTLTKSPAIGTFSLFHEVSRKEYTTGEDIRLEITISGSGNPDLITRPRLPEHEKLVYFEPSVRTSKEHKDTALVFRKQFVYEIIPAYPGTYNLGPVLFYYFNTQRQAYDSLEIDLIPVKVGGDDIPQLMEVNALNHFYDHAFSDASQKPAPKHPYTRWLALGFTLSSIALLAIALKRLG